MRGPASGTRGGAGFREFVALIAALMAVNALAIDVMLPALPAIGDALGAGSDNARQLVVTVYFFGFGLTQLIYGPLGDRFGRKPVIAASLSLYIATALLCAMAPSFELLLVARLAQGGAAAASRVLVISVVRDRFEGAAMARVMSLVFIVFLIIPMIAPTLGQGVLLVGPWHWIFYGLAAYGVLLLGWMWWRLPETLDPANRRSLAVSTIWEGVRETLTTRQSLGYMLAMSLIFSALTAYIASVQQIVADLFGRPELIGAVFAGIAVPMAATSYANSRLVERKGTRRIAHLGLLLFTFFSAVHLAVSALTEPNLLVFMLLQSLCMASFGLATSSFGALAMQPMGHVAGTASSVQGTVSTLVAALIGTVIGQVYDGSLVPLTGGFFLLGLGATIVVLVTERGKLFGPDVKRARLEEASPHEITA